jgi:hypothetical protein
MILTLKEYKAYKNISSDTKDTEYINLINAVNVTIPSYCNRSFTDYYATDKVELFDATDCEYYPKEFPLVSITSIKYSSEEDGVYDETLTPYTDYIVDYNSSRVVAVGTPYFVTAVTPINSGQITYKAGYEYYPEDLVLAAVHLVEHYTEEAYTPRKSLAGSSIDNVIIPDLTAKMPAHIRRTLEHYRTLVL